MAYHLPIWGIWSDDRRVMLESGIEDLDDAKKRAWIQYDAGEESVAVTRVCPVHQDRQLTDIRGRGCRPMMNGDIDHRELA